VENILPFDTETTHLPLWKEPSDHVDQPHLVELAAIMVDPVTLKPIVTMDVIIKPDGWTWDENSEAFKKHGITVEQAMDEGIPEIEAVDQFLALYEKSVLRVAHNTTFDNRIVRIALKRYRPDAVTDEVWKNKESYYCTMLHHTKAHGGKCPTLEEALLFYTGRELENAHRALPDTQACLDIYIEQMRRKVEAA